MGLLHEESRILAFVRPPAERLSQHLILRANNKECTTAWRFNRQLFLSAVWSHLSPSQWLVIDSRNNDIALSIRCHLYHQSSHLIGLISELESVKLHALCYLSWLGPNFGVVCEFTFFNYKPYPILLSKNHCFSVSNKYSYARIIQVSPKQPQHEVYMGVVVYVLREFHDLLLPMGILLSRCIFYLFGLRHAKTTTAPFFNL